MDRAAAAARVDRDLEEHRRTAAAAAARFMPQAQPRMPMSRATGPKIVRPSRAAFAAAADAAASAGVQIDPTIPAAVGPRTAKYAYEGRFQLCLALRRPTVIELELSSARRAEIAL